MRLRITIPSKIIVDEEVIRIVAEAADGSIGILPRRADLVTVIAPGILTFTLPSKRESYVATGKGTLVKVGDDVRISVRQAVASSDLGNLKRLVAQEFEKTSETENRARHVASRLEINFYKRLAEMSGYE